MIPNLFNYTLVFSSLIAAFWKYYVTFSLFILKSTMYQKNGKTSIGDVKLLENKFEWISCLLLIFDIHLLVEQAT